MVEGRPFTLYTDHQSLVPSMVKKTDAPTSRQMNQLSEIAEFTTDIHYLEGKSNFVADALSRPNGVLSKKQAAAVANISSVAEEKHLFLQQLESIQSQSIPTISTVCSFCSQPDISAISQPDPFYEDFYREFCQPSKPTETASASPAPAARQCHVSFASSIATSDVETKQKQMFAAMKQELFSDDGFGPLEPNSSSASAPSRRAAAAAGPSTRLKIPQPRVSVIASSNPK